MFTDRTTGRSSAQLGDLSRGATIDETSLAWFLAVGYVPGRATLFRDIEFAPDGPVRCCTAEALGNLLGPPVEESEDAAIDRGIAVWESVIDEMLEQHAGDIVVPISGGMDSRFILAGLLKRVKATEIQTYTFGAPGSLDFEIGRRVAAKAGTRHIAYDLGEYDYTQKRLERTAVLSNGSTDLFTYPPVDAILRDVSQDASVFWVGFMGDPSVGSHIPDPAFLETWGSGYTLAKERRTPGVELENHLVSGEAPELRVDLPAPPAGCDVSAEELWDIENRQTRYVVPQVLLAGFRYALPFTHSDWLRFSLNLPLDFRLDQRLYKNMLCRAYPDLFSLPVNSNFGLPLEASAWRCLAARARGKADLFLRSRLGLARRGASLNYIDFDRNLRSRADLREAVKANLDALERRDVVDAEFIRSLWRRHQDGSEDYSRALCILASLEVTLRVFKD